MADFDEKWLEYNPNQVKKGSPDKKGGGGENTPPGKKEPRRAPDKEKPGRARRRAQSEDEGDYDAPEARDYHPVRFRRDGRTGCLGGLMYAAFIVCLSVVLACLGWMAARDVLSLGKTERTAQVTIEESFTIDDVAKQLYDAGVIEYKFLFKLFSKISDADEKIDPGTYELSSSYDYRALVKKMQAGAGAQVVTKVTFPEGFTMDDIFNRLETSGVCKAADLMAVAADHDFGYSFLEDLEKGNPYRLEGYLFPDTYDFYLGEQATSVITKLLAAFNRRVTEELRSKAQSMNLSLHDVVIMASLIEKEAADDSERATIASVLNNRLASNMPLQIDATIQYILPERKEELSLDDLKIESDYNTYLHTGLPAGPIASPGLASIKAVLSPETTKFYFYALDEATSRHKFFRTYQEHEAFVATQSYGQPGA